MKSRNPSVSANAEPAPLAGEPERVISSRSRPQRPSSVSLTRASSPGGEAFNLPLRGRGTAAVGGGGRGALWARAVGKLLFSQHSRSLRPSSVSLTRASTTFYGIAATGSYVRFNSLRDAPPGGEALNLPLRGRGTAAAVEEGRCVREWSVCRVFLTAPTRRRTGPACRGLRGRRRRARGGR